MKTVHRFVTWTAAATFSICVAACSAPEGATQSGTEEAQAESESVAADTADQAAAAGEVVEPEGAAESEDANPESEPSTGSSDDAASSSSDAGVVVATLDDISAFFDANEGKVIVINFWATWCKPCIHEMPELAAFDREYSDRGVAFLSLSTDAAGDFDSKLKPYVAEEDLPFTVYAIANLDPDELQDILKVEMDFGLPTTFVLDRNREVVKMWMRNIEKSDLAAVVDPLL